MGRPKESLPFAGSTLLGRMVETLLLCTHPVVVVAREPTQDLPPLPVECEVIHDSTPDQGPLLGLRDGLRFLVGHCDATLLTGCDMPFLDAPAISWLANQLGDHDLVIPKVDGILQPLAAIYSLRTLPVVERLLAQGERSPKSLVEQVRSRILDEGTIDAFDPMRRFLTSLDTIEDYERVLRTVGG